MASGVGLRAGGDGPVFPQLVAESPLHGTALGQRQGVGDGAHSHGGVFVDKIQKCLIGIQMHPSLRYPVRGQTRHAREIMAGYDDLFC